MAPTSLNEPDRLEISYRRGTAIFGVLCSLLLVRIVLGELGVGIPRASALSIVGAVLTALLALAGWGKVVVELEESRLRIRGTSVDVLLSRYSRVAIVTDRFEPADSAIVFVGDGEIAGFRPTKVRLASEHLRWLKERLHLRLPEENDRDERAKLGDVFFGYTETNQRVLLLGA